MAVGKIVQFDQLAKNIQSLIEESIAVREIAYCPYSKFKVGAAVLTKTGSIFTGCNVENAAYGLTICAERSALVKAASCGVLEFSAIAVSGKVEGEEILPPCGTTFTGCNVENAAYGLCICAERTALVKAISSNAKEFSAIAVSAELEGEQLVSPCGECRQFIFEFAKGSDIALYLAIPSKKKILETSINELLPLSFHF